MLPISHENATKCQERSRGLRTKSYYQIMNLLISNMRYNIISTFVVMFDQIWGPKVLHQVQKKIIPRVQMHSFTKRTSSCDHMVSFSGDQLKKIYIRIAIQGNPCCDSIQSENRLIHNEPQTLSLCYCAIINDKHLPSFLLFFVIYHCVNPVQSQHFTECSAKISNKLPTFFFSSFSSSSMLSLLYLSPPHSFSLSHTFSSLPCHPLFP